MNRCTARRRPTLQSKLDLQNALLLQLNRKTTAIHDRTLKNTQEIDELKKELDTREQQLDDLEQQLDESDD